MRVLHSYDYAVVRVVPRVGFVDWVDPVDFVDFDPSASTAVVNGNGGNGFFVKYDSLGVYQFVKNLDGGSNFITDIVLDSSNNIYIGGTLTFTVDFDPSVAVTSLTTISNLKDNYFAKYDPTGNFIFVKPV